MKNHRKTKRFLAGIFVITFMAFLNLQDFTAYANSDVTGPVFKSLQVDKKIATPGDKVTVIVNAEDLESGLSSNSPEPEFFYDRFAYVEYITPETGDYKRILLDYHTDTKRYEGYMIVDKYVTEPGTWKIDSIKLFDNSHNISYIYNSKTTSEKGAIDLSIGDFAVSGTEVDRTAPEFKTVKVDKKTATIGDKVRITVEAEELGSGLAKRWYEVFGYEAYDYTAYISYIIPGSDEPKYIDLEYNPQLNLYEGYYSIEKYNYNPGNWQVESILIGDKVGNYTFEYNSNLDDFDGAKDLSGGDFSIIPPVELPNRKVESVSLEIVGELEPVRPGSKVTVRASSQGSTNPIYKFYIVKDGYKYVLKDYSSENVAVWYPNDPGEYKFIVEAMDVDSYKAFEATSELSFELIQKVSRINVILDKPSPLKVGEETKIIAYGDDSRYTLFKFYIFENGAWKLLKDYSYDNELTWKLNNVGEYKFLIQAKNIKSNDEYDASREISYTVGESKVQSVSVSTDKPSPGYTGKPINITASSTGSVNPVYRFYVLEDGVWKLIQDYSNKNTVTWTPSKAGEYKFSIHAKDAKSNSNYEAFNAFNYTVKPVEKVTSVSAILSKASPINEADVLTMTFTSKGSSNVVYQVVAIKDGQRETMQYYSKNNNLTWISSPGQYQFLVYAKDANSNADYEAVYSFNYTVKPVGKVTSISATTSQVSPSNVGTPVTIIALAKGSSNALYKFHVLEDGVWKVLYDYGVDNVITWTPSKPGTYKFSIHAKNANSSVNYEAYYAFDYTVKNAGETQKVNSVSVTTDKASPANVGTAVTLTAKGQGSSNAVYRFYVLENGAWKLLQDYSSKNTVTWKPSKAGAYKFSVHAKDINSSAAYESYYAFDYTAKQAQKVTSVSATTSKVSPVNVGTSVTITGKAQGSSTAVYRFYVLENGVWKLLQDYSSKNSVTWKPSKAGTYKLSVHAKDVNSSAAYESYYAFDYKVK